MRNSFKRQADVDLENAKPYTLTPGSMRGVAQAARRRATASSARPTRTWRVLNPIPSYQGPCEVPRRRRGDAQQLQAPGRRGPGEC